MIPQLAEFESSLPGGRCYLAIQFKVGPNADAPSKYLVTYFPQWFPNLVFHGAIDAGRKSDLGGLSRMTPNHDGGLEVLCSFNPVLPPDDVTVDYLKTFFRPVPDLQITEDSSMYGWVSPGGSYYSCTYAGHEGLASSIVAVLFNKVGGSELIEDTWVKTDRKFGFMGPDKVTPDQRSTLFELASKSKDRDWSARIMDLLVLDSDC